MSEPSTLHKKSPRRISFVLLLVFVGLLVLAWTELPALRAGLLPKTAVTASTTPDTFPVSAFAQPSSTAPAVALASTIDIQPTAVPAVQPGTGKDLIVFSMSDGQYDHLFAFQPQSLPLTRLTDNPWDDIDSSVSPDGSRIAYSSRRNGYWDIYILDLLSGDLTRVTDTPEYEGSPTWSPDGQWLAYETYARGNLDIYIQSLADLSQPPIQLTDSPAADYDPAWSPEGREIAFVSTRSGEPEIWTAQLDQIENRFSNISQNSGSLDTQPDWSPDGKTLAWSGQVDGADRIMLWDTQDPAKAAIPTLDGTTPVWSPTGDALLVRQADVDQISLAAFKVSDQTLALPFTNLPGEIHGIDWADGQLGSLLPRYYLDSPATPPVLYQTKLTLAPVSPSGRYGLVKLDDVNVPYPYLHDAVDEAFNALRAEIARQSGWDFLQNLENCYIPITEPPSPGSVDDWLQTGRAFAVNPLPIQAGWMAVVKEVRGDQTYWRLYVRTRYQDGSQGQPMNARPWDFDLRYSGDTRAYEDGGAYADIPSGYWIDFTELAARYGFQPLPALQNWRTFYPAARFNQFAKTDGLDWAAAMAQFYPPEALTVPTQIPTYTLTPTITPTIRFYKSVTPTPVPTQTPQPTRRPTWTPLPGQSTP